MQKKKAKSKPETLNTPSTFRGRRPSSGSPLRVEGVEGYQMGMFGWDPPMKGRYIPKLTVSVEDGQLEIEVNWQTEDANDEDCPNDLVILLDCNFQNVKALRAMAEMILENDQMQTTKPAPDRSK